eukprot:scaffold163638_cov33-Tisochrysis_lutea.AAC.3
MARSKSVSGSPSDSTPESVARVSHRASASAAEADVVALGLGPTELESEQHELAGRSRTSERERSQRDGAQHSHALLPPPRPPRVCTTSKSKWNGQKWNMENEKIGAKTNPYLKVFSDGARAGVDRSPFTEADPSHRSQSTRTPQPNLNR